MRCIYLSRMLRIPKLRQQIKYHPDSGTEKYHLLSCVSIVYVSGSRIHGRRACVCLCFCVSVCLSVCVFLCACVQ